MHHTRQIHKNIYKTEMNWRENERWMILHSARGRLVGEIAGEIVEWTVSMIQRDNVGFTERMTWEKKEEEESAYGFMPVRFRAV